MYPYQHTQWNMVGPGDQCGGGNTLRLMAVTNVIYSYGMIDIGAQRARTVGKTGL